jgi:hypothetical protein
MGRVFYPRGKHRLRLKALQTDDLAKLSAATDVLGGGILGCRRYSPQNDRARRYRSPAPLATLAGGLMSGHRACESVVDFLSRNTLASHHGPGICSDLPAEAYPAPA